MQPDVCRMLYMTSAAFTGDGYYHVGASRASRISRSTRLPFFSRYECALSSVTSMLSQDVSHVPGKTSRGFCFCVPTPGHGELHKPTIIGMYCTRNYSSPWCTWAVVSCTARGLGVSLTSAPPGASGGREVVKCLGSYDLSSSSTTTSQGVYPSPPSRDLPFLPLARTSDFRLLPTLWMPYPYICRGGPVSGYELPRLESSNATILGRFPRFR